LIGVNACYFRGDYGHDLSVNPRFPDWPVSFEPLHAYAPLVEAKKLGFDVVRIWLCENAEGIVVDERGAITGVHETLLNAVAVIQEAAALHGLYVYPSLLDGNAWPREGDPITHSIFDDADQAARFAERVVAKIAAALDPRLTLALEIVNEPETSSPDCADASERPPVSWEGIGRALRLAAEAVGSESAHLVTAGTGQVFLPALWAREPALTAVDVHVYHPEGGLPSRADLAERAGDPRLSDLPLFCGEAGIPKESGAPEGALVNYVYNTDGTGYDATFLWQLEGDLIDKSGKRRVTTALGHEVSRVLAAR
jgi:hypothetical protein